MLANASRCFLVSYSNNATSNLWICHVLEIVAWGSICICRPARSHLSPFAPLVNTCTIAINRAHRFLFDLLIRIRDSHRMCFLRTYDGVVQQLLSAVRRQNPPQQTKKVNNAVCLNSLEQRGKQRHEAVLSEWHSLLVLSRKR